MFKNFKKKALAAVASVVVGLTLFSSIPAGAIDFNGTSGGGGGSLTAGGKYTVAQDGGAVKAQGYRFSVVDYYGNTIKDPIDVLIGSSGNNAYRFVDKYNKIYLRTVIKAGGSVSTAPTNAGVCHDTDIDANLHLPTVVNQVRGWIQTNEVLFSQIVSRLGVEGGTSGLEIGSKVTIEPLFRLTIEGTVHCLTSTEIAAYGRWMFGGDITIRPNSNSGSWGFISDYTNRQMPISLFLEADEFTDEGNGNKLNKGWNVPTKNNTLTFNEIIDNGFGIAFAYNDNRPPATDLKATEIKFKLTSTGAEVSEPLREYEQYTPVYCFYNDGPACTATLTGTNNTSGQSTTKSNVSIGATSTYTFDGEPFVVHNSLYNANNDPQDYTWDSRSISFSEKGEVSSPGDSNTANNTLNKEAKFAVATPNSVIGASTYEEYGANYSGYGNSQKENLYTGLTDVAETSAEGYSPNNSKYSVSNGVVKITSNNTRECGVKLSGEAYLTEGKVYRFSVNTNGTWLTNEDNENSPTIEAVLNTKGRGWPDSYSFTPTSEFLNGIYGCNVMHKLDDGSFIFACRKTSAYTLVLEVNKSPGTITFSDIRIEEYGTTTYLGQFGGVAIDNGIAYDRLEGNKLYVTNKRNEYSYISYYGNPAANRIAPVYLIEGQKYVVNVEAQSHFFMFWESDGPYAGSNTQGGTISVTQPQVETAYPNGVYAKRIGEKTYTFIPKKTGNYYWRFDIPGGTGATYWFKAPEIYNVTEQEQLNITGGNLYTGFKDATLPTRTYYERIIGETVIKNKTATVTNTLTSILQVSPSSRAQEAYFYDTTGDVNLVAGQKYIFQCETNGTWAISGDELKESVPAQELIHNGDNVQVYLIPMDDNGNAILDFSSNNKAMITIGEQKGNSWTCMTKVAENTYMFTARKTGKYRLRLDVNKMGKTYWFKNPQIYNVTACESYNLFVPLYDYEEETTQGKLVIRNNKVTITAKADDGCMSLPGYMRLEEGQEYYFSCDTDGNFENGEVEMYLFPSDGNWANANSKLITTFDDGSGVGATWEVMKKAGKNKFTFTCRKSGEYFVRLDVNKNGLTRWFSNLKITKVNNKKDIDITSIKLNTVSKKLYSGQQVRFHSETQSLSMFNAKYTTELSATGINSAEITPQTINNMLKTIFNPFSGGFTPSFAKWATTLTKDSRPKYTNRSGLGAINVTAVSYENTIMGKYAGRDDEFKNTVMRKYDVYPTDLEAVSVKVYDIDTGKQITAAKDGQKVKVEYIYKNNTQLPVFATVFYTGNANKTFSSPTVEVETGVTEIKKFSQIFLTLLKKEIEYK